MSPIVRSSGDAEVAAALAALTERPERTGLFTDFDGTLAAIVDRPGAARPLPGSTDALRALSSALRTVAVVSGRPLSLLERWFGEIDGLVLVGLYGLEARVGGGNLDLVGGGAHEWASAVAGVVERWRDRVPPGAELEDKRLAVTLHWRRAPEQEGWARSVAGEESARTGLAVHDARASVELRPPVPVDKGAVVARLLEGCRVAAYLGDDAGDLPAFDALDTASEQGVSTWRVGVADSETPEALVERADVVLPGPEASVAFLARMVDALGA